MRDFNTLQEDRNVFTARPQRAERNVVVEDVPRAPVERLAETSQRTASLKSPFATPKVRMAHPGHQDSSYGEGEVRKPIWADWKERHNLRPVGKMLVNIPAALFDVVAFPFQMGLEHDKKLNGPRYKGIIKRSRTKDFAISFGLGLAMDVTSLGTVSFVYRLFTGKSFAYKMAYPHEDW
ncbi:hypothetical protein HY090_03200 [Candidatus Kaiserbacteria bacterium]|nr:hypothetical protein [Candidatus Kaiserbacteria bacterium]